MSVERKIKKAHECGSPFFAKTQSVLRRNLNCSLSLASNMDKKLMEILGPIIFGRIGIFKIANRMFLIISQ
jgi:hypothetical protein